MVYSNVREKLLLGSSILSKVVGSTMGPNGRNVIINRISDNPNITKDGVTVARNVYLQDSVSNIAVRLIREAAMNVLKEAGDGTTTATVLTNFLFKCASDLQSEGHTAIEIKEKFEGYGKKVIEILSKNTILITEENKEYLKDVATISANNDSVLGETIYNAFEMVGLDGNIEVVPSKNSKTYIEQVEGINYNNGYVSPYFVNNPTNRKTEYNRPVIVYLFDKKLESMGEIEIALRDARARSEKEGTNFPVLFICADYSAEAMSMLVINKQRGFELCAVRAAEFGDYRKAVFQDLAQITGAEVIDALTQFNPSRQGLIDGCIISNKSHTLFTKIKASDEYVDQLKQLYHNTEINFDRQKIKDRISKLTTGIAKIHVGAKTELELGEKVDRVDDAVLATRAALEEGVVAGGGTSLLKAAFLATNTKVEAIDKGIVTIENSFVLAIASCLMMIAKNSYYEKAKVKSCIEALYESKEELNKGFNFSKKSNSEEIDLIEAGIIDPFKVTRVALENALSISMMLLTADNVVEYFDNDNPTLGPLNDND